MRYRGSKLRTALKTAFVLLCLLVVLPTATATAYFYSQGWPSSWSTADWSSTGTAPDPKTDRQAIIQVYAARAGRWKGAVAVHSWIALKARNASAFTRYDVVGWGQPVRRNGYPVDGRWYSNTPQVVLEIRGRRAADLIPKIERAIARYPYAHRGDYDVWPGPNSNSFIAWIGRQVPELGLEMPSTAVGKDFIGTGFAWAPTPSGTGWQVSLGGYLGAAIGWKEGLEVHILGTTLGIDIESIGIKLPGFGLVALRGGRVG